MKNDCPFKEVVIVWWKDAFVEPKDADPFESFEKQEHPLTINIGVRMPDRQEDVIVASGWDAISSTFDTFTVIPREMVKFIQTIKVGANGKRKVSARNKSNSNLTTEP